MESIRVSLKSAETRVNAGSFLPTLPWRLLYHAERARFSGAVLPTCYQVDLQYYSRLDYLMEVMRYYLWALYTNQ